MIKFTTGMSYGLIVLGVRSHENVCFFLLLKPSYKPANDSTTVSYGGQTDLTNSQNMVFRHESANLDRYS